MQTDSNQREKMQSQDGKTHNESFLKHHFLATGQCQIFKRQKKPT